MQGANKPNKAQILSLLSLLIVLGIAIPFFAIVAGYLSGTLPFQGVTVTLKYSIAPAREVIGVSTLFKCKNERMHALTCLYFLLCTNGKSEREVMCKKYYGNEYSISGCENFIGRRIKEIWNETKVEMEMGDYEKTFGTEKKRSTPEEIVITLPVPFPKMVENLKFRVW